MNGGELYSSYRRHRVYPWGCFNPPQCRWQGRSSKPPQSFFFLRFSFSAFFCLKKQKQTLSDVVIPSTLCTVLCLRKFLQRSLQAGLKDRGWKERMPGEPYITRSVSKQIKKAEGGFYCEADSCVPKSGRYYNLMAWDWTLETHSGLQVCRKTHTHTHKARDYSQFPFSCRHIWKSTAGERERWDDCVILNACIHVHKPVYVVYVCVCVSRNWISVSAALHNVSQHILIQIHHWELLSIISHSLWLLCLLQGYTVEYHLKGWEGSFAAGCPLSKHTCETGKGGEDGF